MERRSDIRCLLERCTAAPGDVARACIDGLRSRSRLVAMALQGHPLRVLVTIDPPTPTSAPVAHQVAFTRLGHVVSPVEPGFVADVELRGSAGDILGFLLGRIGPAEAIAAGIVTYAPDAPDVEPLMRIVRRVLEEMR